MRREEPMAGLTATAPAGPARLVASAHVNRSALDRCTRAFLVLAVVAVSLVSLAYEAAAQKPVHRIAVLWGSQAPEQVQGLRDALHARGYDAGRNLQIEWRFTQGQPDRLPALVAELVALRPDIIVAGGSQIAVAVRDAAPTIPLVFIGVTDPVAVGLVPSLARPAGNVTGVASLVPGDFTAKLLDLLKTVVPATSTIAVLNNPSNPIHQREQLKLPDIARRLGVELVVVQAGKVEQLETAFQEARARGAGAILVSGDTVTVRASGRIANLCLQYGWPSIYLYRQNVEDGGLMSYGSNLGEQWPSVASQIDKILKGAKPGDLPIEQPTHFDLIINLKTAKALGITLPATLLAQAADVIE